MRLLHRDNNGDLSLTEFFESATPKYAILSHRWGAEEVTFADLMNSTAKDKAGYRKIQFCGEQARHDGLQYFWVDTCCIDKSSSNELAESINSMFRWYQRAARCYVYLSDVSTLKRKASETATECTVLGNLLSDKANGLHEAGPFRSSLPHAHLNSSLRMVSDWEIRELLSGISRK
jgi:hypothetical protein